MEAGDCMWLEVGAEGEAMGRKEGEGACSGFMGELTPNRPDEDSPWLPRGSEEPICPETWCPPRPWDGGDESGKALGDATYPACDSTEVCGEAGVVGLEPSECCSPRSPVCPKPMSPEPEPPAIGDEVFVWPMEKRYESTDSI